MNFQLDPIQWGAVLTGILYVVLAARQSVWCWFWGAISTILSGISFYQEKLFSDTFLQGYYLLAAVYGAWAWKHKRTDGLQLQVTRLKLQTHLLLLGLVVLLAYILGKFWIQFGASLPYIDAILAALSILATWMTTRKIIENWLYWILIDAAYVGMYIYKDLYLFVFLYAIYTAIAIQGFVKWRHSIRPDQGFGA